MGSAFMAEVAELVMPEVVTVRARASAEVIRHALRGMLYLGEDYPDAWSYTSQNRTVCGSIARGREQWGTTRRGMRVTCQSCRSLTSAWLVRQGLEIGPWEWHCSPADDIGGKFSSVAAEKLWGWSLEGMHDDECGDAVDGTAWHGLFRDLRVVLTTDSHGFVGAVRYETDEALSAAWDELSAEDEGDDE